MISYSMAKVCKLYLVLGIVSSFYTVTDTAVFGERAVLIDSFKYWLCQPSEQAGGYNFRFRNFGIGSNECGDLNFTGTFITKTNLTSPLKATINLKRSVLGVYIPLPCMGSFGSCTYEDVCEFGFPEGECPPVMEELKYPCGCPIQAGKYNIPIFMTREMFVTMWAPFLSGSYSGIIKLYKGDTILTCYNVEFTLK